MTYRQAIRLFVTCMAVLCFVSFYTSKVGYQTTTKDFVIYWGMAFGGALFQFSTFWFLAEYFARGTRKERVRYGAIAGAICVLVFWFSTQWSVVSMGGKDAVSTHMQRTLAAAEMQGLRLYRRAATEANVGPQLQALSQNFNDLARREAGGAFSGLQGEGDVVATLRNTSQLFANLAGSVRGADKESREDYDRVRELIGQARATAARMEGTDISDGEEVRKNNLEFARQLGDINAVMARMAQTSSVGFVREVNKNLTTLTMSAKAEDRPEQKAAVERLKALVDGAQTVVGRITSAGDSADTNVEIFTMLSTQRAIWTYWRDILYAWAGATTLDFAPLFFMVLLAIASDREKQEQSDAAKAPAVSPPLRGSTDQRWARDH
ncbi:MAG TPA: hypothetical protein VKB36_26210 [Vicinamibacterales bacterium]|nr:hypothetical protein [Vicinamibacterales bacterium]